jgi:hypothetical protein
MTTCVTRVIEEAAPTFANETVHHSQHCEAAVEATFGEVEPTLRKVLVNLYRRFAPDVLALTAVTMSPPAARELLLLDGPQTAFSVAAIQRLCPASVPAGTPMDGSRRLAAFPGLRSKTVAKMLANWAFAALGAMHRLFVRARRSQEVLRSWVDVSVELFPEQAAQATILVYPFGINPLRQLRYLRWLHRRKFGYTLAAYPYSATLLLRWLWSGSDLDLAQLEIDAAARHAAWLIRRFRPTRVLTTDEFEPASFVLNEALMKAGVEVVNKAHGVGKYSPYVTYSQMWLFNEAQREFYSHFNPQQATQLYPRAAPQWPLVNVETLVLVDQLCDEKTSIHAFQQAIAQTLRRVGPALGFRVAMKLHPNSSLPESIDDDGFRRTRSADWPAGTALFLTAYSTAYLSFESRGPTWLVENAQFDPRLVFGSEARVVHIDALEEFLRDIAAQKTR